MTILKRATLEALRHRTALNLKALMNCLRGTSATMSGPSSSCRKMPVFFNNRNGNGRSQAKIQPAEPIFRFDHRSKSRPKIALLCALRDGSNMGAMIRSSSRSPGPVMTLRNPNVRPRFSRRAFLKTMGWAPMALRPAPFFDRCLSSARRRQTRIDQPPFPFADVRLSPHYPAQSPLADVLRLVAPGSMNTPLRNTHSRLSRF